ncbi:MAG: MFS transporter [Armatimonadetes bacterium]|nr:MFS transporter [Armatimonadota bacterium]
MGTSEAAPVLPPEDAPPGRWGALRVLAAACFLGMTCWFSASAVLPQLRSEWSLSSTAGALLTVSVQLGFVVGSLCSAFLNVADLIPPRRLMLWGALASAAANGLLLAVSRPEPAILLRFLTGAALAFVYPPGLKAIATWFRKERGTALGAMVGSLTLGSAFPHLLNGLGGAQWRWVIGTTSVLTLVGGLLAEFGGRDGPFPFPRARFDPLQASRAFANPGVRLACLGYFGHQWELYAVWSWFAAFFADVLLRAGDPMPQRGAAFATFAVIGVGAWGCWFAGRVGDRWGRARIAALALTISGACCLAAPLPGLPPWAVLGIGLVWGFWVVADSAQFSTIVTEVGDQSYIGTAVTMQLAIGFVLTAVTIWLAPLLRDGLGWQAAFGCLAVGPALGVAAMLRLQRRLA